MRMMMRKQHDYNTGGRGSPVSGRLSPDRHQTSNASIMKSISPRGSSPLSTKRRDTL